MDEIQSSVEQMVNVFGAVAALALLVAGFFLGRKWLGRAMDEKPSGGSAKEYWEITPADHSNYVVSPAGRWESSAKSKKRWNWDQDNNDHGWHATTGRRLRRGR